MSVGLMRQVHQIVDHDPIVSFDMVIRTVKRPVRMRTGPEIRNEVWVNLLRIPYPNPHESISLDDRISFRADALVRALGRDWHLYGSLLAFYQRSMIMAVY